MMDLRKMNNHGSRSINQYQQPLNFELAGKTFTLLLDDGYDCVLSFIDGKTLEWNIAGGTPAREQYKCMKGDDTTYLVSFEVEVTELRKSHLYVLDLENYLVTRQIATIGENPRWPYLINTSFTFGAIDREGYEYKSYPRHGFTSDVSGNVVQWSYGSELTTVHVYHCSNFYRITYPLDTAPKVEDPDSPTALANKAIRSMMQSLPSRDEPTNYIKIKEGMYLVSLTEQNAEKLLGEKIMYRSNNLTFLQNYKRIYQVGFGYGTSTLPEGDSRTFVAISAYGKLLDPAHEALQEMLHGPNPYLV